MTDILLDIIDSSDPKILLHAIQEKLAEIAEKTESFSLVIDTLANIPTRLSNIYSKPVLH